MGETRHMSDAVAKLVTDVPFPSSGPLGEPEQHLCECFAKGEWAAFEGRTRTGRPTQRVRAELLRWICGNHENAVGARVGGLRIRNLRVIGTLELDGISL